MADSRQCVRPTTMTHMAENVPSFTFNGADFRDLDGPPPSLPPSLPPTNTNFNSPGHPLTSCCSPTTPAELSPSHCHWSCPQTRFRASRCRASRCRATRCRCRSSRCRPSLRPRAGASASSSCLGAGSPGRPDAHG